LSRDLKYIACTQLVLCVRYGATALSRRLGFVLAPASFQPCDDLCEFRVLSAQPVNCGSAPLVVPAHAGLLSGRNCGVTAVSNCVVVHNDLIKEEPELIRGFVVATLKGFLYGRRNLDEMVDIARKYSPAIEPAIARREAEMSWQTWTSPNTEGKPFGWMSEKDWEETVEVLKQYGGVAAPLQAHQLYTNDFVPIGHGHLRLRKIDEAPRLPINLECRGSNSAAPAMQSALRGAIPLWQAHHMADLQPLSPRLELLDRLENLIDPDRDRSKATRQLHESRS